MIIIGAGASGLMCAATAGARGRRVAVVEHSFAPGRKLLITGGGRCNFTNRSVAAENFVSQVPKFCKSALSRYGSREFIKMLDERQILFAERDHGQLFCRKSAAQILDLLVENCREAGVQIICNCGSIGVTAKNDHCGNRFVVETSLGTMACQSLVVATGGLSLPETGASDFGLKLASQFGLDIVTPTPGLVPFTLSPEMRGRFSALAGISVNAVVSCERSRFRENLLFTHRGFSGPAILQISSYWRPGKEIAINFVPDTDLNDLLLSRKTLNPLQRLKTVMSELLPRRLVEVMLPEEDGEKPLAEISNKKFRFISELFHDFRIIPAGTEGFRSAEVTVGGVDCRGISSRTFMANNVAGLFFIGEVLDVAGWLGGYNLQWAWSSGWCAGQHV